MLPEDMSQMLIINVESVIEVVETGKKKKRQDKEVLTFKFNLSNLSGKYIQLGKF